MDYRNNFTSQIWINPSPGSYQQLPEMGLNPWLSNVLTHFFGPTCVIFWILEELSKAISENLSLFQGRALSPVDVCLSEETRKFVDELFSSAVTNSKSTDLPKKVLSYWLMEQLKLRNSHKSTSRAAKFLFCVRCIESKHDMPLKNYKRVDPKRHNGNPPFWFHLWQPPTDPTTIQVESPKLTPDSLNLEVSKDGTVKFGFQKLKNVEKENLPLVSNIHIQIAPVTWPTDRSTDFWVKNLSKQETWLIDAKDWSIIPDDAWTPMQPESRLILGRVGEIDNRRVVFPGSMIIKIKKTE